MINDKMHPLYKLVMQGVTFQSLMDLAEELLNNPLSCSDTSFRHRALSKGYPEQDIQERDKYRRLSSADEYFENTLRPYQKIHDNTPFVLLTPGACRRIICKNYIAGRHVGHIAVPECSTPLEEMDAELIRRISDVCAICYVMQRSTNSLPEKMDPEQSIFEALLNGEFRSEAELAIRVRHYTFERRLSYRVFIARHEEAGAGDAPLFMRNAIRRCGGYCWMTGKERETVMLLAYDCGKDISDNLLEEIKALCLRCNMTVYVSDEFENAIETKRHYENALRIARRLSKYNNNGCHFFNDYKTDVSILSMLEQNRFVGDLCLSEIQKLMEFDRANHTELTNTLATYIANGKSLMKSAEKLFVHKNTVLYRMKKAEEIARINTEDPNAALSILFSYRVLQIAMERADGGAALTSEGIFDGAETK